MNVAAGRQLRRRSSFMHAETVITKFRGQLNNLLASISSTDVQYIRCIKPNKEKSSTVFDRRMVVEQLRCAGMIEAIRISRVAYPFRLLHAEFVKRFGMLTPPEKEKCLHDEKEHERRCRSLLATAVPAVATVAATADAERTYEVGSTRVYFTNKMWILLETLREQIIRQRATRLQAVLRGLKQRRAYRVAYNSVVRLQCLARQIRAKRIEFELFERLYSGIVLQTWVRKIQAISLYTKRRRAALLLSALARGNIIRARLPMLRLQAAQRLEMKTQKGTIERLKQEVLQYQQEQLEAQAASAERQRTVEELQQEVLQYQQEVLQLRQQEQAASAERQRTVEELQQVLLQYQQEVLQLRQQEQAASAERRRTVEELQQEVLQYQQEVLQLRQQEQAASSERQRTVEALQQEVLQYQQEVLQLRQQEQAASAERQRTVEELQQEVLQYQQEVLQLRQQEQTASAERQEPVVLEKASRHEELATSLLLLRQQQQYWQRALDSVNYLEAHGVPEQLQEALLEIAAGGTIVQLNGELGVLPNRLSLLATRATPAWESSRAPALQPAVSGSTETHSTSLDEVVSSPDLHVARLVDIRSAMHAAVKVSFDGPQQAAASDLTTNESHTETDNSSPAEVMHTTLSGSTVFSPTAVSATCELSSPAGKNLLNKYRSGNSALQQALRAWISPGHDVGSNSRMSAKSCKSGRNGSEEPIDPTTTQPASLAATVKKRDKVRHRRDTQSDASTSAGETESDGVNSSSDISFDEQSDVNDVDEECPQTKYAAGYDAADAESDVCGNESDSLVSDLQSASSTEINIPTHRNQSAIAARNIKLALQIKKLAAKAAVGKTYAAATEREITERIVAFDTDTPVSKISDGKRKDVREQTTVKKKKKCAFGKLRKVKEARKSPA